jgi:hypothetical protein
MQSSETLRNSLGLNYKSAALNQLSYAGVPAHTKAAFSEFIKRSHIILVPGVARTSFRRFRRTILEGTCAPALELGGFVARQETRKL